MNSSRRKFILQSCSACASFAGLALLIPGCGIDKYISGKLVSNGILLEESDFLQSKKSPLTYNPFVIVRNEALKFPICVYRKGEADYTALYMRCTHQGSELLVSGERLQCPAHGSEFDNNGSVRSGPASVQLRTFPVSIVNKQIFIDLRKQS